MKKKEKGCWIKAVPAVSVECPICGCQTNSDERFCRLCGCCVICD